MHWTDRRTRFREVLNGNRCVHPGSVYDAISARIAEDLGFELGMFAGSVASLTVLGAPDLIVLTLSEFAQQAYRINRAGKLPLMVDADHGYGNALNVKRTVEELETAGIGGMSIEDTELPTPFGTTKPRLTTIAEGVGKMKAALAGRQDPLLAIAGRTSAIQITGLDDAIARGKAYEAAGVDATGNLICYQRGQFRFARRCETALFRDRSSSGVNNQTELFSIHRLKERSSSMFHLHLIYW